MAMVAAAPTYGKLHKEQRSTTYVEGNKYAKANVGKQFEGNAPEWVTTSQCPNNMNIKANQYDAGVFQKKHECVIFYWCTKCKNHTGTAGKWNKNHPTKLHDQVEAAKKTQYRGKKGSYSNKREGDQSVKALQAENKRLKKQLDEKS